MPRSFPTLFDLFNNDTTTALYFQCILIAPNSDIYRFAIPVPVDYDHVRLPCFLWQRQHTFNTPLSMYLFLSYPSAAHPARRPTFIIFPSYCYLQPSLPAAHPARRPHLHHLSKLLLSATLPSCGAPCAPPGLRIYIRTSSTRNSPHSLPADSAAPFPAPPAPPLVSNFVELCIIRPITPPFSIAFSQQSL